MKDDRTDAEMYVAGLQKLYNGLCSAFPDRYTRTKDIVRKDIEWMNTQLEK